MREGGGGGKVHAPKEPLEQRTPKQHSANQKHHSTTHILNFYLYGRVNARRDGQSEHLQCSKTGVKKSELINRPSGNTPGLPFCNLPCRL